VCVNGEMRELYVLYSGEARIKVYKRGGQAYVFTSFGKYFSISSDGDLLGMILDLFKIRIVCDATVTGDETQIIGASYGN